MQLDFFNKRSIFSLNQAFPLLSNKSTGINPISAFKTSFVLGFFSAVAFETCGSLGKEI